MHHLTANRVETLKHAILFMIYIEEALIFIRGYSATAGLIMLHFSLVELIQWSSFASFRKANKPLKWKGKATKKKIAEIAYSFTHRNKRTHCSLFACAAPLHISLYNRCNVLNSLLLSHCTARHRIELTFELVTDTGASSAAREPVVQVAAICISILA